jgi:hypothetical protein
MIKGPPPKFHGTRDNLVTLGKGRMPTVRLSGVR